MVNLIIKSKSEKFDFLLIHHSNFYSIAILPLLKIFFKDIRIICHVGTQWKHIKIDILRKISILFLRKFTNKIFVISDDQIRFLNDLKVEKINSIISKKFVEIKKIQNDNNQKYILFLARVCVEKGIDDLLLLYEKYSDDLPKMLICGPINENSLRSRINMSISKSKNKIIYMGPIYDDAKKINLIDNCLFGIYPSYYDAFPLTPIEFFSRDKICITSNISESVNFVKDSNLLITPGNIKQIKKSISYSKEIIKNNKFTDGINDTISLAKEIAEGKIVHEIIQ